MAKEYILDGAKVTSLESFYEQVSISLIPGTDWGRNLDSFNDILRGGFGTPERGFILRWTHSDVSREHLGYPETVRQLERQLERCHSTNRATLRVKLGEARQGKGATVFDWLVEIIRDHDAGGEQAEDNVRLVLE